MSPARRAACRTCAPNTEINVDRSSTQHPQKPLAVITRRQWLKVLPRSDGETNSLLGRRGLSIEELPVNHMNNTCGDEGLWVTV